ncbi:RHS repeat-associated core domain-containing protein [Kitasatospora sp. SolWspMP-SS2h]|uniref:RHS repeat-associated core domain-containing protein n=1 Tax=Kitasatospora sp. SolWspMP-SS2h TaxID=1305729 RepID=UPI0027297C20|nr:RHS repeat-associated core domain-containing protein [Kitasatospora sp. SolWspMP-SS2h]
MTTAPASQPSNPVGAPASAQRSASPQGALSSQAVAGSGQGEIPWNTYTSVRLHDALVAKVNLATGNLLLAATDLDLAAVGQRLQLTRSFNSTASPSGPLGHGWFAGFDRYLVSSATSVVAYGQSGEAVTFGANADGTYQVATGYDVSLTHNAGGTWTLLHRKDGTKETYNASGSLASITDRNGDAVNVAQHTDTNGSITGFRATDARSGRWIDLTATGTNTWKATDSTGRTVSYAFSGPDSAQVLTVTDTENHPTVYAYDSSHRVVKATTPEGRATAFTYDSGNRVTSVTRITTAGGSTGLTTLYAYSASNGSAGTTTVTDPAGHNTIYTHDGSGQSTSVEDALHHSRSTTWDASHNQATATDALGVGTTPGNTTTFGWSGNNPTSAKLPLGATALLGGYAARGGAQLPATLTDPQGNQTTYSYDDSGNLTQAKDTTTGGSAAHLDYTYNPATPTCGGFQGQRCSATDQGGNTTTFAYDTQGNLTTVTPPAPLGKTTITYDSAGRPASVTDGRGLKTTYEYDKHDRPTVVDTPNSRVELDYDTDGNLTQRHDAAGISNFKYDPLGRETWRKLTTGDESALCYDAAGNVDEYSDPSGTITYGYDDANRLTSLTEPGGAKTTYDYDSNNHRKNTTFPGGAKQDTTFDNDGRPTSITATSGTGTVLSKLAYTYTTGAGGSDGTKTATRTDNAGNKTTYAYTTLGRLTRAVETNTSGTRTAGWLYCYDNAGNLTTTNTTATSASTCTGQTATYGYNAASELTTANGSTAGWSYDGAGNETGAASPAGARSAETWSEFTQLAGITTGGTHLDAAYAGTDSGERTRLGTTDFANTALGVAAIQSGTTLTGMIREPSGTLTGMTRSGATYHYLTDAQGSVTTVVNSAGQQVDAYTYTPYGTARTTTESVAQPWRYTGAYLDPTGLYKLGARYYDPALGRFTQPDPSGRETNAYAYTAGDPVNHTDPNGLENSPLEYVNFALGTVGAVAGIVGLVATSPVVIGVSAGIGGAIGIALAVEGAACLFSENC